MIFTAELISSMAQLALSSGIFVVDSWLLVRDTNWTLREEVIATFAASLS